MRKVLYLIFLCAVFYAKSLFAASDTAEFLSRGIGARGLAMGSAFTAVADDATAAYWNPAGFADIKKIQSSLMIQSYSEAEWPGQENISPTFQYFNVVVPMDKLRLLDKGVLAISVVMLGIDDVPHTYLSSSGNLIRDSFNDTESAYCLSLGYPLIDSELYVGGSLKFITQEFVGISGGKAIGWDMDAGIKIFLNEKINLGFIVKKGAELKWENSYIDKDPMSTRLGISYKEQIKDNIALLTAMDLIQEKEQPLKTSVGFELQTFPNLGSAMAKVSSVDLRAGIDSFTVENRYGYYEKLNKEINWNIGGGLGIIIYNYELKLDYAFQNKNLGSKHMFSVNIEL